MSNARSSECFNQPELMPFESTKECEASLLDFFSGRGLVSQTVPDEEQKKSHDEKYQKELDWDVKDTAKGKPVYKKYRKELLNELTKCDAQYINNLHTYYGDGSKLKQSPKAHYAVDFICPNSVDTEATTKLKKLEVFRKKKSVSKWINEQRNLGFLSTPLRRSFSCTELTFNIEPSSDVLDPEKRKSINMNGFITNLDKDYKFPGDCLPNIYFHRNISATVNFLISRVNAYEHKMGILRIRKVLFSREDLCAYVIPAEFSPDKMLKEFSAYFEEWYKQLSEETRIIFGTDKDTKNKKTGNSSYFWRVNVILCLKEFESEGTMFRRARHVCQIGKHIARRDLYIEIDTGMLRSVETNERSVRRMPHEFAHIPTPILEVRFEGAKTPKDVSDSIAEIRKAGYVYIGSFVKGTRPEDQRRGYEGSMPKTWSNIETAVLLPLKKYPKPSLTSLFCGEKDCMGLCCTANYLQKSEISPSIVNTPSSWTADKEKTHFERSPKKFKYPPNTSFLRPADMGSFFKR